MRTRILALALAVTMMVALGSMILAVAVPMMGR